MSPMLPIVKRNPVVSKPDSARRRPQARRPDLERLEIRQLMSADVVPRSATRTLPISAIVEIWSYYKDATTGAVRVERGTGALVGPHDVLTAAHVVEPAGQPTPFKIVVFPGMNGLRNRPFGQAVVTKVHVNSVYNKNDHSPTDSSAEWDLAMLNLDRNIGSPAFANWLAFGWVSNDLLDQIIGENDQIEVAQYPTRTAAIPTADGFTQFAFSGPIAYNSANPSWLYFDESQIPTSGGSSGSPLIDNAVEWIYPTILGVFKGFDRSTTTGFTAGRAVRITQDKYNWLVKAMQSDGAPKDLPQLMDWDTWSGLIGSSYSPTGTAGPGSDLVVHARIWNGGTANAGTFKVKFYLSTTQKITSFDIPLGTVSVSRLNALKGTTVTWKGRVPSDLKSGPYYVGWIINPGNAVKEYPLTANAAAGNPSSTGLVRTGPLTLT
jgi:V8-like Glu-specific endopeptidase